MGRSTLVCISASRHYSEFGINPLDDEARTGFHSISSLRTKVTLSGPTSADFLGDHGWCASSKGRKLGQPPDEKAQPVSTLVHPASRLRAEFSLPTEA